MWDMEWGTRYGQASPHKAALEQAEKSGIQESLLLEMRAKAGLTGSGRYLQCACTAMTWYTGGSGIYCIKCGILL